MIPKALQDHIENTKAKLQDKHWGEVYDACFRSSWETTAVFEEDGTTFMITGDIPAMWLRDSTMQVFPYLAHLEDETVRSMVRGVIRRQARLIVTDPYANAFNKDGDYKCWSKDHTVMGPMIWERKYEVDSLAMPLHLLLRYYKATGDEGAFSEDTIKAIETVIETYETEQKHEENSPYSFERDSDLITETLQRGGKGTPTGYTGMTWSGFRPSDDACTYHYLVPSNMLACAALEQLAALNRKELDNARIAKLAAEIRKGIAEFAVTKDAMGNAIYAYETDGLGNYNLMDDANMPSLLCAPYYGFCAKDDPLYLATRNFVLSAGNPFYYSGCRAAGVGSPHTPKGYVWHIALASQGLTTDSVEEKERLLRTMMDTDAGCGQMHESFDPDDPEKFTRPWFAWANAMFCLLTDDYLAEMGK